MSSDFEQCVTSRNHVTLACPGLTEMETIVDRLKTDNADWADLQMKSDAWMEALIMAMAGFMWEDDLKAMIMRVMHFLYLEAMKASTDLRETIPSLTNQPPKSSAEHTAFLAALIAGVFRAAFEGANRSAMSWLRNYHEQEAPTAGIASSSPETTRDAQGHNAPEMQTPSIQMKQEKNCRYDHREQ